MDRAATVSSSQQGRAEQLGWLIDQTVVVSSSHQCYDASRSGRMTEFESSWHPPFTNPRTAPRTSLLSLLQAHHLPHSPLLITHSSMPIIPLPAAAVRDEESGFVVTTVSHCLFPDILLVVRCNGFLMYLVSPLYFYAWRILNSCCRNSWGE